MIQSVGSDVYAAWDAEWAARRRMFELLGCNVACYFHDSWEIIVPYDSAAHAVIVFLQELRAWYAEHPP